MTYVPETSNGHPRGGIQEEVGCAQDLSTISVQQYSLPGIRQALPEKIMGEEQMKVETMSEESVIHRPADICSSSWVCFLHVRELLMETMVDLILIYCSERSL